MTEGNETPPPPPPTPGDQHGTPAVPPQLAASGAPLDYSTGATPGAYAGPVPDANAKQWAMIAHLSALVQLLTIPTIVGPLVVWLLKKQEHAFIDDQGKEAMNFHLTVLIAALVLSPTLCIFIGFILLPLLGIVALIFSVIGGIKANEGIAYRYPWTMRLIK